MAVYVEKSMKLADSVEVGSKLRRYRESVRIAQACKRIVEKCGEVSELDAREVTRAVSMAADFRSRGSTAENTWKPAATSFLGGDTSRIDDLVITREAFKLLLQDPDFQHDLRELDIESDLSALFDVVDVGRLGCVDVTTLVSGLLKVRG